MWSSTRQSRGPDSFHLVALISYDLRFPWWVSARRGKMADRGGHSAHGFRVLAGGGSWHTCLFFTACNLLPWWHPTVREDENPIPYVSRRNVKVAWDANTCVPPRTGLRVMSFLLKNPCILSASWANAVGFTVETDVLLSGFKGQE